VPSNVFFEIFDGEDDDDWTYPEDSFDLIHLRNMNGSIKSWDRICERVYTHLKPRGWIEIVDFEDQTSQFASHFKEDSEVQAWFKAMAEAAKRSAKDVCPVDAHTERLNRMGFKDVKTTTKDVPMGLWPTDPATKNVAKLWLVASLAGLEAMSLRPLTQELGWAPGEVRRMCYLIEKELKSIAMNEKARSLTSSVQVIIGQKPFAGPLEVDEGEGEETLEVDEVQPESKKLRFSRSIERWEGQERLSRDMSADSSDEDPRERGRDPDVEMRL
jgi:Methyltransferase domain